MATVVCASRASVLAMEDVVLLDELRRDIVVYRTYITKVQDHLLEHFAYAYLKERKRAEKRRGKLARRPFAPAMLAGEATEIPSWIAVLNLFRLAEDIRLSRLFALYAAHIDTAVVGRVQTWASAHPYIAKPLCTLMTRITRAVRLPYGARLRVIMQIMEHIQEFCNGLRYADGADWQRMYEFVMVTMDKEDALRSIIVWNASVLAHESMERLRVSSHFGILEHILSGFVTMIVDNPELRHAFVEYVPAFK
jgi:hypothetical protein